MMQTAAFGFIAPSLLHRSATSFTKIYNNMAPGSSNPTLDDPHLWLEDVLGERPLSWVAEVNKKCIDDVGDPKETESYKRIKDILDSKVRDNLKEAA